MSMEEDGEGVVSVTMTGSLTAISLIRRELTQLRRVDYALNAGRVAQRASAYFMSRCTFLMLRGSVGRNVVVRFVRAPAVPCQPQHRLRELSMPAVKRKEEEGWRAAFVTNLREKILEQVGGGGLGEGDSLIDTLRLDVHFGLFYGVDALVALEGSGGKIMLPELEAKVAAQRTERKAAGRQDWDTEDRKSVV